jgi:small subunit ribosomal protein S10
MKTFEVALRITLKAYEHNVLDTVCKNIIDVGKKSHQNIDTNPPMGGLDIPVEALRKEKIKGPIPLPTKIRRYCVLTSPHVYKKARDHFEIRTHKRIIEFVKPSTGQGAYVLLEKLKGLEIPAGVDIKIKKIKRQLNS